MASETITGEEKRELPPQEEQTEESGESNDLRGAGLPEEKCNSFTCLPGRSHHLESCLADLGISAECK